MIHALREMFHLDVALGIAIARSYGTFWCARRDSNSRPTGSKIDSAIDDLVYSVHLALIFNNFYIHSVYYIHSIYPDEVVPRLDMGYSLANFPKARDAQLLTQQDSCIEILNSLIKFKSRQHTIFSCVVEEVTDAPRTSGL